MDKYAIIVAGGLGTRMAGPVPKQFLLLNDKTLLWHSVKAFVEAYHDISIILVLHPDHLDQGPQMRREFKGTSIEFTAGGDTRFHSVKNGLGLVKNKAVVFVHDGVRCLVTPALIRLCYETTLETGNAVPALIATDSIRIESPAGNQSIDRNSVRIIQTPQTFYSDTLIKAFGQDYAASFTDEAGVVENTGVKINLVPGEATNIKITRPLDLVIAASILEERSRG